MSESSSADVVAIDAGGGASGTWSADVDYTTTGWGGVAAVTNAINTTLVSNPAPQTVYQTQRWAPGITYTVRKLTSNTKYTVRLHFVESYWNASQQRLFNVAVNGTQVLNQFDVFKAAGGMNIAIAESFSVNADTSGTIKIQLTATLDRASIAGIEILAATSAPITTPSPTTGDTLPWIYSELWSSASPFKTTVATQKANGAVVVQHGYMDNLWNEGIAGNSTAAGIPIYVAKASDPLLTASCTLYGGGCNAKNVQIHVPSYATPEQGSDAHMTIVDSAAPGGPVEIDCWQAVITGASLRCSWAGAYSLYGKGLSAGGEGIHGGMAVTTVFTTGQELLNGHIDHALGMDATCLNSPSVFPADAGSATDASCDGSSNPPHYGNLVHLLWSQAQISASPYSSTCKTVLTALATYGAYLDDTGDNGIQLNTQNELSYTANSATKSSDPWPGIQSILNAAGDGTYNGWMSCLNRLASSDFELLQIAN